MKTFSQNVRTTFCITTFLRTKWLFECEIRMWNGCIGVAIEACSFLSGSRSFVVVVSFSFTKINYCFDLFVFCTTNVIVFVFSFLIASKETVFSSYLFQNNQEKKKVIRNTFSTQSLFFNVISINIPWQLLPMQNPNNWTIDSIHSRPQSIISRKKLIKCLIDFFQFQSIVFWDLLHDLINLKHFRMIQSINQLFNRFCLNSWQKLDLLSMCVCVCAYF